MVEWAWRWRVKIRAHASRYDAFGTNGEEIRYVDTVDELRGLVLAARNDPRVMSLSYERERYLIGRPPTECPRGHPLAGPSAVRATTSWRQCECGGHTVYTCRACGAATLDPVPGPDCTATED
jgi:hypothetical protein